MDVIEKIGESVYMAGIQVKNKAKEVADIASLKAQVTTCDEVIRKNYISNISRPSRMPNPARKDFWVRLKHAKTVSIPKQKPTLIPMMNDIP